MLSDIFSDADSTLFHSPTHVYTFKHSTNGEIVPISPLAKQASEPNTIYYAEVLIPADTSLISIYEALDQIEPLYQDAAFEWHTTICPAIQAAMLIICVTHSTTTK